MTNNKNLDRRIFESVHAVATVLYASSWTLSIFFIISILRKIFDNVPIHEGWWRGVLAIIVIFPLYKLRKLLVKKI